MNTTTNKQDETLGKIIYEFYPETLHDYVSSAERAAFATGANWQKEQDKVIIDKLVGALEKAERLLDIEGWVKKAQDIRQLLQSLK